MDFDVIWTGAHQGRDADLLCCAPVEQKRTVPPGEPEASRYGRISRTVEAALGEWITVSELAVLAGCSTDAVHVVFQRLRRAQPDSLECQLVPIAARTAGQGWKLYRLKPAA